MKRFTIEKNIIFAFLILFAFHISMRYAGRVFSNLDESPNHFYGAERNSVDMVFVGSSHQYCSVDTNILNDEYGFNSMLLSSSSQNFKSSYFAVMEAIRLQHPQTIVLEMHAACLETDEQTKMEKHVLLDSMPNLSPVKWEAVRATGDPLYYYYYPISVFHEAWMDFKWSHLVLPEMKLGDRTYSFKSTEHVELEDLPVVPEDQAAEMSEPMQFWLEKIISACRENDVELVMYTVPYQAEAEEQMAFNGLYTLAAEYGLSYFNLFHEIDDIGIDISSDFKDAGHFNCRGQEKFTRYIAENILTAYK